MLLEHITFIDIHLNRLRQDIVSVLANLNSVFTTIAGINISNRAVILGELVISNASPHLLSWY